MKHSTLREKFSLNAKGKLLIIDRPVVMGIINSTPDSFYVSSAVLSVDDALLRAEQMLHDGAEWLDIGGMSSRPGSKSVAEEVELSRVVPLVEKIKIKFPEAIISVDTYRSRVAKEAVLAGADIVNDISSGMFDPQMLPIISTLNVPYIAMHTNGTPDIMQDDPKYEDVTQEIIQFFIDKKIEILNHGIKDIVIDPGFGFGKTLEHNYQLLKKLSILTVLECPVMIGVSRKSMIYKILDSKPEHALNGSTALHTIGLMQGAQILRVHDVKEAVDCIKLYEYYLKS